MMTGFSGSMLAGSASSKMAGADEKSISELEVLAAAARSVSEAGKLAKSDMAWATKSHRSTYQKSVGHIKIRGLNSDMCRVVLICT